MERARLREAEAATDDARTAARSASRWARAMLPRAAPPNLLLEECDGRVHTGVEGTAMNAIVRKPSVRGLSAPRLGLPLLANALTEPHGGTLRRDDRPDGGTAPIVRRRRGGETAAP